MQSRSSPGDCPAMDDSYWQALLEQGEFAPAIAWSEISHRVTPAGRGPTRDVVRSPRESRTSADWEALEKCYSEEETLELKITGSNKGGLMARLEGTEGFVPASQLVGLSRGLTQDELRAALDNYVGRTLKLKIVELDPERDRLIFSEKATTAEGEQAEALLEELEPGQVRRGVVRSLCDFGGFVDLGGVDGLIHISELSWGRVNHPQDVLEEGQEVDVYVMSVDRSRKRIALSLKRLYPDPWSTVEERYEVGDVVTGTVTNVVEFGVFVRIEEGLDGLVHVSELGQEGAQDRQAMLEPGDEVEVRILSIDAFEQRMALSIRQAPASEGVSEEVEGAGGLEEAGEESVERSAAS